MSSKLGWASIFHNFSGFYTQTRVYKSYEITETWFNLVGKKEFVNFLDLLHDSSTFDFTNLHFERIDAWLPKTVYWPYTFTTEMKPGDQFVGQRYLIYSHQNVRLKLHGDQNLVTWSIKLFLYLSFLFVTYFLLMLDALRSFVSIPTDKCPKKQLKFGCHRRTAVIRGLIFSTLRTFLLPYAIKLLFFDPLDV